MEMILFFITKLNKNRIEAIKKGTCDEIYNSVLDDVV
jgi:hypothetical protein